jgi:Protein of unknown function (DUF2442)
MGHLITSVSFLRERKLRLGFSDGTTLSKDLAPLIARGGVFARLADEAYWRKACVGDAGRSLDWPPLDGDPITALDFCANALWFEAHPEEHAQYLAGLRKPVQAD